MPVYDSEYEPGETVFGGGAGILFMGRMGRGSKTSQTTPTEKSQDSLQAQPSSGKEAPALWAMRESERRLMEQSTTQNLDRQQYIKEEISMSDMTTITKTDSFIREVEIRQVSAQPNSFHIQFTSRLLSAKNPEQRQMNFDLILDRGGLTALRDLIDSRLLAPVL